MWSIVSYIYLVVDCKAASQSYGANSSRWPTCLVTTVSTLNQVVYSSMCICWREPKGKTDNRRDSQLHGTHFHIASELSFLLGFAMKKVCWDLRGEY